MDSVKRLGFPFAVLILSALLSRLLHTYVHASFMNSFMIVFMAGSFFLFGTALRPFSRKKHPAVFLKVISIVLFLLLLFLQLDVLRLHMFSDALRFLGISGAYMYLLYVFCGYMFME